MKTFSISSTKLSKEYIRQAENLADVIQWIENTLDLSQNWEVTEEKTDFSLD